MTLYNYGGIIVQEAQWDVDAYPFGYLARNVAMENVYALFISDMAFTYDAEKGVIVPSSGATVLRAAYYNDTWYDFEATTATELLVAEWTNTTILDTEGGEFLGASIPLLYEMPLVITNYVTVDLLRQSSIAQVVHAVQDDKYSRDICFAILSGGQPWTVPAGATVTVRFLKPDGTGGNYDTMPDGGAAATIEGNTVTVKLAPQVLTVAGKVRLAMSLESGGTKINTFTVVIQVESNPGVVAVSSNFFKIAGTLSDAGWTPNMILGTDENGNVIAVENPADRMEELVAGINAALDELIGEASE